MFDEEPDADPHGECREEIRRLEAEIARLREGLNVIAGRSWGCGCDCCVKSSDIARAALSHSQAPEPCPKCADSPDATQAREMLAYVLGIEHGGPAAPAPGGE